MKKIFLILFIFMTFFITTNGVNAASFDIGFDMAGDGEATVASSAEEGDTVYITNIQPGDYYWLSGIEIWDGECLENITDTVNYDSSTYSFIMPSYPVTVRVAFQTLSPVYINLYDSRGNSVAIMWDSSSDATGYKVYRSNEYDGTYTMIKDIAISSANQMVDYDVEYNKTYYYKVVAYNNNMESEASNIEGHYVNVDTPQIGIIGWTYNSFDLSWGLIPDANGYVLYRSDSYEGPYSVYKTFTSGSTMAYTNTGLLLNKEYHYRLKAYVIINNKKIYSDFSNKVGGSPGLDEVKFTATKKQYRYIKLSINKVNGATGYAIYRANSIDGTYSYITRTTNLYYYDKSVAENKTYYYKIKPYRTISGKRYYGNDLNYLTAVEGIRLSDYVSFSLNSNSYNSVTVTINKKPTVSKYYIYRATSRTGKYTLIKTLKASDYKNDVIKYTNTKLTYNKVYYYKIKPYYYNSGDYSSYKSVRTKLAAPTVNIIIGKSFRTTKITLGKVTNASGYEIYRSKTLNGTYSLLKRTKYTSYQYDLTASQYASNKTYYYKVRAYKIINGKRVYGNYSTTKLFVLE